MFNKLIIYLKNFDWIMFTAVLLLICFGLAEIYSVAIGRSQLDLLNFKKQILFIILGIILLFLLAFFDYHSLRSYSKYFYVLGFILLIGVLLIGQTIRGTKGWYNLADFNFQPVEFIKFVLILFLAKYFSSASPKIKEFKRLLISGSGVLLFIILVLAQPDFGSAFILFLLWLSMIILVGFNKKYFLVIGFILVIVFSGSWYFVLRDYQKQRIVTFLNPSFNPLSQGYNVSQAIIAVGAGGLTGRGLGFGSQSQLKFLPEAQTDFIFAVVAEELGFSGVLLILLFFGIFFYRCLYHLKRINNNFGIFFILGSISLIFIEMFINISMNLGILPVVGISLPFLSYGGSGLISSLMLVGVIESIVIRSKINY
ncbi:rod shape-determining protein RodA [Patescibacteria group bacterium]|nr:rod shape-determining protein RodA [Patescibacteria group bacterium]MBU1663176.1 rod shape-determining protein RodA [Patescibacteria group bacterium]MBU1934301.1 rod shape-determining protein RodA [Patescibacteria group bacterium]MBU2008142.1 rod shape-determining protein RodA [Patescibacteria group bacterium]MBU2233238.1 rod shape-determining protein RodA [Patescibacteria group bacterium]